MSQSMGVAGRVAAAFIHSKLTPLVIVASLLLGVYAVVALPREEEPQIIVPMIDVFVDMPGASPTEVEQRVARPIEQWLWEVPGVEYLYSTSQAGRAMVIVRFLVGQDEEQAIVRLNQKLAAHAHELPPGASPPHVQARSIDDVPVPGPFLKAHCDIDPADGRTSIDKTIQALAKLVNDADFDLKAGRQFKKLLGGDGGAD